MLLVSGGHDQACAALGSGVIAPGLAMVSTGTAEVVEVAMASPALRPALREGGISVYRHVVPGLYVAMTLNHSGGLLLRWFRDTLGQWEMERAAAAGVDAYDLLLREPRPARRACCFCPTLPAAARRVLDVDSKGALLGLTFATTKAEVAKAALEGLTFELRLNLDLLRGGGGDRRAARRGRRRAERPVAPPQGRYLPCAAARAAGDGCRVPGRRVAGRRRRRRLSGSSPPPWRRQCTGGGASSLTSSV